MSSLVIQGTVVRKSETVQVSDRFKKREIVIEHFENPDYKERSLFEFVQNNVEKLDGVGVGDRVEITFNLRGREYQRGDEVKVFNTLTGWKIAVLARANGGQSAPPQAPNGYQAPPATVGNQAVDEIPF